MPRVNARDARFRLTREAESGIPLLQLQGSPDNPLQRLESHPTDLFSPAHLGALELLCSTEGQGVGRCPWVPLVVPIVWAGPG